MKIQVVVLWGEWCVRIPWRWRQQGPPKRLYRTTSLYGVTT